VASTGAVQLAATLNGRRYRGLEYPIERKVRPGDIVVCWGEQLQPINGVQILNGAPFKNKLQDAITLRDAGVPTIEFNMTRPVIQAAPAIDPAIELWNSAQEIAANFIALPMARTPVVFDGLSDFSQKLMQLHATLARPLPSAAVIEDINWVGRLSHHIGGNDLLNPPNRPDFWVKKENITREFRVHSFKGRSIRSGMKIPRVGVAEPHSWIRSWDSGWRISYDGSTIRQRHRDIAHRAIIALGLDFGAVDVAEKADGSIFILEVNRAPGLEGGTIRAYADAINLWKESL